MQLFWFVPKGTLLLISHPELQEQAKTLLPLFLNGSAPLLRRANISDTSQTPSTMETAHGEFFSEPSKQLQYVWLVWLVQFRNIVQNGLRYAEYAESLLISSNYCFVAIACLSVQSPESRKIRSQVSPIFCLLNTTVREERSMLGNIFIVAWSFLPAAWS